MIFYHDEEQKRLALETKEQAQKKRNRTISTAIGPYKVYRTSTEGGGVVDSKASTAL